MATYTITLNLPEGITEEQFIKYASLALGYEAEVRVKGEDGKRELKPNPVSATETVANEFKSLAVRLYKQGGQRNATRVAAGDFVEQNKNIKF